MASGDIDDCLVDTQYSLEGDSLYLGEEGKKYNLKCVYGKTQMIKCSAR